MSSARQDWEGDPVGVVATRPELMVGPPAVPPSLWTSVRVALPAWVLARVLVLGTLWWAMAHFGPDLATGPLSDVSTLQVWDVAWYRNLGVNGYGGYGPLESRFFPLLPMVVGVGATIGLPAGLWATAACWIAALFFAAFVHRLTIVESGDPVAARRAAWLVQLLPGANVLALGYTEAFAGMLAVGYFLAIRTRRDPGVGTVAGVLSGLTRPTGLLLTLPGLVEQVRTRRVTVAGVLLVLSPVLGTCMYLAWAWHAFGDPLTPLRVQATTDLRGAVVSSPWEHLFVTSPGGYPWGFVLIVLAATAVGLLLCAWRLPVSYTLWSLVTVGAAVTAYGMHSLPRYIAAVFPLAMAAVIAIRYRFVWWVLIAVSTVGFTWVSYLNLTPGPVP